METEAPSSTERKTTLDSSTLSDADPTVPNDGKVGYGQPPVHTRFKPGRSGNPRGRPKVSGDIGTALRDALNERVPVVVSGVRKNLSKKKALLVSLTNKSLNGDMKALATLVKIGVKIGSIKPAPKPRKGGVLYMPRRFWDLTRAEQQVEMVKEAARRDARLMRGLTYEKTCMPE